VAEAPATSAPPTSTSAAAGPGTLYVVATPIGNLGDVSLRAIDVLRSVAVVAAEDTRLTRRLWARHGIETHLVSYHAQSSDRRALELLARLRGGDDVAIVTDAGTPLVSDPGGELVSAWADVGGRVVPIPGPSAVLAALVASGIPAPRWAFEGFLPRRGRERHERLARIAADDRTTVLFEAPGRTAATLRDLAAACGPERRGALCRELTKLHEEIRRGSLESLAAGAIEHPPRGEVTIVVGGGSGDVTVSGDVARPASPDLPTARAQVARLVAEGQTRSAAARAVARETGLPRRALFHDPEEES
jgi:16S rRNA (cytidine1402-2'-O)-methyltransferase